MIEMICNHCGKKFFCNADMYCSSDAKNCICKNCSIKEWGNKDAIQQGHNQQCYGGIIEGEQVQFT